MKKQIALVLVFLLVLVSCSKKDDEITCLEDVYSGTYVGNITIGSQTTPASVKFTKKSCSDAQIESAADIGDKNISSIFPNGDNGFSGTLTQYGSPISMKLTGNTITIIANSRYTFIGTK